jgi:hypothetical protein
MLSWASTALQWGTVKVAADLADKQKGRGSASAAAWLGSPRTGARRSVTDKRRLPAYHYAVDDDTIAIAM